MTDDRPSAEFPGAGLPRWDLGGIGADAADWLLAQRFGAEIAGWNAFYGQPCCRTAPSRPSHSRKAASKSSPTSALIIRNARV